MLEDGFDPDEFALYLARAMPSFQNPISLERISGGQSNPTFFVESPTHRLVLRKQPVDLLDCGAPQGSTDS